MSRSQGTAVLNRASKTAARHVPPCDFYPRRGHPFPKIDCRRAGSEPPSGRMAACPHPTATIPAALRKSSRACHAAVGSVRPPGVRPRERGALRGRRRRPKRRRPRRPRPATRTRPRRARPRRSLPPSRQRARRPRRRTRASRRARRPRRRQRARSLERRRVHPHNNQSRGQEAGGAGRQADIGRTARATAEARDTAGRLRDSDESRRARLGRSGRGTRTPRRGGRLCAARRAQAAAALRRHSD